MTYKTRQNNQRQDDEPRVKKTRPKRRDVVRLSNPQQIMGLIEDDQR